MTESLSIVWCIKSGRIDTEINLSGNLALAGTGHLTENNVGCLG